MKTKLIHACLFTPTRKGMGLPIVLIGPPGSVKSDILEAVSAAAGWHMEPLATGERGEGAYGVTPMPETTDGKTVLRYPPPDWIENFQTDGVDQGGIVFVDELNSAPPALQPALMGLILDKRIGGAKLGSRVRVVGAMNRIDESAGGWDLAPPVANRFGHLKWEDPTAEEWSAWLCGGGENKLEPIDVEAEEQRVMDAWPEAFAKASGLVGAFVQRRPELLRKQPPASDPKASGAWPSPRTWEFATRALASSYIHNLTEVEADELISAFVGTEAAAEFVSWVENQDLPNPADLLDGNVKWEHDPTRFDRTIAVLASCVALVTPEGSAKRNARAEALWKITATLMDTAKDLAVDPATALASAKLSKFPAAKKVLVQMHNVVIAAKDKEL